MEVEISELSLKELIEYYRAVEELLEFLKTEQNTEVESRNK